MRRRSRTRRVLKWVALVGCVLLISAWAISIQYNIMVGWKKWKLTLLDGQLWLWEWRAPDEMCTGFRSYVETRDPSFHTYGLTWVKGGLCPWIGGNRRWSAPLWLPLMLGIVPTAILWYRDRRPPKGHCQACGYDLTGNVSGVCPECGEATGEVTGDRAACHRLTRSGMRTRLPKPMLIWGIALLGLLAFLGVSICYGSSGHPAGMVLSVAPITPIFAFSISTAIARLSRRPVTVVDAIRIACWTGFGSAVGVQQMAASYYAHYWPQYSTLACTCAVSAIGFCLLIILFVTLCFPVHKPMGEPHCPHCNYDLTGNVSGTCPECGEPKNPETRDRLS